MKRRVRASLFILVATLLMPAFVYSQTNGSGSDIHRPVISLGRAIEIKHANDQAGKLRKAQADCKQKNARFEYSIANCECEYPKEYSKLPQLEAQNLLGPKFDRPVENIKTAEAVTRLLKNCFP